MLLCKDSSCSIKFCFVSELSRIPRTSVILYSGLVCSGLGSGFACFGGDCRRMICSQVRSIQMWRGGYVSHPPLLTIDIQRSFFVLALFLGKGFLYEEEIVTNEEF